MSERLVAAPAEAAPEGARDDLPPVPRAGVSLAALRAFADEHRGRSFAVPDDAHAGAEVTRSFDELTTAQVCALVVKPATLCGVDGASEPCTYAELLTSQKRKDTDGQPHVARATRFVSHAWECLFSGLLAALEAHADDSPEAQEAHFWIDIFVGTQHKTEELPQEWWTVSFRQAVGDIGHTVLVLQPWSAPVPLKRSWCLWEIFCSVESGARLDVALSREETASFQDTLLHRFHDIALLISRIDTRTASAFHERDQAMIADSVRSSNSGFEAVNGSIHGCLRGWLAAEAHKLRQRCLEEFGADCANTLDATEVFAHLLSDQGKLSEAEPLFCEVLHGRRGALGDAHPKTLSALNNLANLLMGQGKLSEAEPLCREALHGLRGVLGSMDPKTLSSLSNLALLLSDQGKFSEAEPLYREALHGRRQALGDAHPDTLSSLNNLARLLIALGKLSEAEPLLREALRGRREALGDAHPRTLSSLSNLALLLSDQGKLSEAEPLCREALRGRRQALGNTHPDTLSSLNNLALLLSDQGKLREAEPHYREALRGWRALLGDAHPKTLSALNNLAYLLIRQGELSEAEPLWYEAPLRLRKLMGDAHPKTLPLLNNLAGLLRHGGKLSDAEPLLREVLRGRREALGGAHPDTLTALNNLAVSQSDLEHVRHAVTLYCDVLRGRRHVAESTHPKLLSLLNYLAGVSLRQHGRLNRAAGLRLQQERLSRLVSFQNSLTRQSSRGRKRLHKAANLLLVEHGEEAQPFGSRRG